MKPAGLGRSAARCSLFLAAVVGLISCSLLTGVACAQAQPAGPAGADSAELLPWLEMKAGCWEVCRRVVVQTTGLTPSKETSVEEAKRDCQDRMSHLTPEQRAQLGPEQVAATEKQCEATYEVLRKAQEQNVQNLKKGIDSGPDQGLICSATPFADARGAVYNAKDPAKHCARNVNDSGGVRHMHIACNDFENDYERIDAEHFRGTTQVWGSASEANANGDHPVQRQTTTFTAKWIDEGKPHLPYSPPMTDLDGARPKGPYAVGWLDPYRLVAEIDGRQFIAEQAFLLINNATVGTAENYGPALSDIFQKIYMHYAVGAMAIHLHLDQQQPWKSRLDAGARNGLYNADRFRKFDADPGRSARYSGEWNQVVNRGGPGGGDSNSFIQKQDALWTEPWTNLLWEAYFSQYKSKAEKDAALEQVKGKYKLTILDPDFFAGTRRD